MNCWLFAGSVGPAGYGVIHAGRYKERAHRTMYENTKGRIPDGLEVDHLCRVRHCINPEHLEDVTHRENVIRGAGPTAINSKKTHCKRGHLLTPDSVYIQKGTNYRACKMCGHLRTVQRYARIKAIGNQI